MNNYKTFFFEKNKSGYKTKENWLKKNNPDLHKKIINNSKLENISFKEKIYLFLNDLYEPPKCGECGNYVNFTGKLNMGYNKYCSISCLNKSKEHKEKIKNTFLLKYGVESHNQLPEIKEKKKKSNIKKFGVDNPIKLEIFKKKQKKTLYDKYGVDNPMHIEDVKKKRKKLICSGEEKNIERVIKKIEDKYVFIKHENGFYYLICKICNKKFKINSNLMGARFLLNNTICLNCNKLKSFTTLPNLILDNINNNYILNDRKEIKKEIDIFFPKERIGVEINGLFWHSEKYKNDDYHIKKTQLAEKNNIRLLHFFEDEVIFKLNIVKSIINVNLNKYNEIYYARNCIVKEINDNNLTKKFLNENHIQGYVTSKIKIGLFLNDELLSIMTFSKKRKFMNSKSNNDNEYELVRFCNKLNTKIIGGGSKIFNFFTKKYQPQNVISYVDRRLFTGKLYENLNFKLIKIIKPTYYYIKAGEIKRYYRFKFRKDVLIKEGFDATKTEHQIMNERGYYKIFNCGHVKYEYTPPHEK